MAAQSLYSHSQLLNKSSNEMQEMLFQRGINWNDYPVRYKRGAFFRRTKRFTKFTTEEIERLPLKHDARANPDPMIERHVIEPVVFESPLRQVEDRVSYIFG